MNMKSGLFALALAAFAVQPVLAQEAEKEYAGAPDAKSYGYTALAVGLATPAGVRRVDVLTAQEMHDAVLREYADTDAVIKAAAVADYRPKERAGQKIKKKDGSLFLELVRNPDILKELGEKKKQQVLVGFAAETERVLEYAAGKLKKKNLDFIVANDVSRKDAGFSADTNCVTILGRDGSQTQPPLMSKRVLADVILDCVARVLAAGRN